LHTCDTSAVKRCKNAADDTSRRVTDGLDLLRQARTTDPQTGVIVMTAHGTIESAVKAMKEGACDYIEKPINQERFRPMLSLSVGRGGGV
jgi:DNA-binding NtrC family response regulator